MEERVVDAIVHGRFAWYELLTTERAAATHFYARVVGWEAKTASTAAFPYTVFSAGKTEIGGLMELPPDARRMGATPRWVGYVAVDDIDDTVDRLRHLGGSVFVPPTDSNIGRVSIVADPQTATFGLVGGLKRGGPPRGRRSPGRSAGRSYLRQTEKRPLRSIASCSAGSPRRGKTICWNPTS